MPTWNVHFDLRVEPRPGLTRALAEIRAFSSVINGIPLPPRVQDRLHSLNIMRAVRATTGIEGADLSEEEVEEIIAASKDSPVLPSGRQREEREARNANELMRRVERILRENPERVLTESLIREFHAVLTDGIPYANNEPGKYRAHNVTASDYFAPAHERVPALMANFVSWLNEGAGGAMDPIAQAVVAHFLLVSIHPFGDGNGRASRGVESFLLYKAGVNVRGFYSLANYYYRRRAEYVEMLNHARFVSDPDVTPFVDFALQGMVEELRNLHEEALSHVRLFAFRDYARETLEQQGRLGTKTGERQLRFLLALAGQDAPLRDLRSGGHPLARLYRGLGAKTVSRDLNYLRQLGLIVEERGAVRANIERMNRFTATG